ncbi:hypothetical protein S83_054763, partial [Arachis hypogaea]
DDKKPREETAVKPKKPVENVIVLRSPDLAITAQDSVKFAHRKRIRRHHHLIAVLVAIRSVATTAAALFTRSATTTTTLLPSRFA